MRYLAIFGCIIVIAILGFPAALPAGAQTPDTATAPLHTITVNGLTRLTQEQFVALSGLQIGSQVGRKDLQDSADRLLATGLFEDVNYEFNTYNDTVSVVFRVKESPRLPVFFDNIPWFGDSELNDAIRAKLPFYDGTLPEGGDVIDTAADAVRELIATHKLDVTLEHGITINPMGEGRVQMFSIQGASLSIAQIEFSDAALSQNLAVQQHVAELVGKPFSRLAIDVFLNEHVRPIYLKQGNLRVQLGPAQVRLTGNPNLPLPTKIPVFIPVVPGPVYHLADVQWTGNNAISTITLDTFLALKRGDIADGMALQAAWNKVDEEYGRRGYLEAKIDPAASYDDTAHMISYKVSINEGQQYHMGGFVLTGISPTGEHRIYSTFPIANGDVFDKTKYEDYLIQLDNHSKEIFGELPIHYDTVGHWLRTDPAKSTVDVLLDFK
jgi:outer membrane protein insertion porin family